LASAGFGPVWLRYRQPSPVHRLGVFSKGSVTLVIIQLSFLLSGDGKSSLTEANTNVANMNFSGSKKPLTLKHRQYYTPVCNCCFGPRPFLLEARNDTMFVLGMKKIDHLGYIQNSSGE
jgi:hypothetical protein